MLVVALITVTAMLLMAQAKAPEDQVIRGSRLELLGDNGEPIVMVGTDDDGSRGLFVYDDSGRVRVVTVFDQTQSAWYALDSDGAVRAGVAHYAHGGSGVAVHGTGSRGAAVLYYKDNGSLTFYDTAGIVVDRIPAN